MQENRSFDNLFAKFPGANGTTRGKEKVKQGSKYVDKWVSLKAHALVIPNDLQHCHASFETEYDGGAMDGFNLIDKGSCPKGQPAKLQPYEYVKPSEIAPYWDIAKHWILADEMFQTQGSGSFTAHQDLIRGGTCITTGNSCALGSPPPSPSPESLVDNPTGWPWGCDAHSTVVTALIDVNGKVHPYGGPFPCTNKFPDYGSGGYKTLRDLLDNAGITWKYYTPCFSATAQSGCTPSNECVPSKNTPCDANLLNAFDVIYPVRYGAEWGTNVSWPETNIFSDIKSGQLPAVSWVIPEDNENDHPGEPSDNGPAWVASVVNAVGQSKYWDTSAIIVVWDDWGGLYDHVVPPFQDNAGGLGFRVPMLVVSPYAIKSSRKLGGHISNTQYEFGSIVKYIEDNWNLPSLGTTDGRAASIADVFNYSQARRKFIKIPSKQPGGLYMQRRLIVQHGDAQ